jgi:hypothetical protein
VPLWWVFVFQTIIVFFSLLGLSTTPTTDDVKIVLASNSNNTSSSSSTTSFNSTRTFLQKQPSLVASSTSTATSKSRLESSYHDINSLSTSSSSSIISSKSFYYRAATNTHTTANDDADDVHQHLVESFRKPTHYERHDNDNNEDNHHLNLNDSQNISIANWGNSKNLNSSDNSSSRSNSNTSSSSSNGGNNSRIRNTNDNNKRRSIQHQPHEPDINQNHIDGDEATTSSVPMSAGEIYFGTENFTTITTQIGSVVVIPCTVYNIDEETVRMEFSSKMLFGKLIHCSDMVGNYAIGTIECILCDAIVKFRSFICNRKVFQYIGIGFLYQWFAENFWKILCFPKSSWAGINSIIFKLKTNKLEKSRLG